MSYTVRVALQPPSPTRIGKEDAQLSSGSLSLALKECLQYHVLTVEGFGSEDEALIFLNRLPAGMAQVLLENEVAVEASLQPQILVYNDDPIAAAANLSKGLGVARSGHVLGACRIQDHEQCRSDHGYRDASGAEQSALHVMPPQVSA